jgi:MFS family permease
MWLTAPMNSSPRRQSLARGALERFSNSRVGHVFGYADFRLMWLGAFLSFTGSRIQIVAEGFFVFQMTGSESKLAFVSFCSSLPVLLFAFLAGTATDHFDKRKLLVVAQLLLGFAALFMSAAIYWHFIEYWQIVVVALFIGCVSCFEMPTRQSIVSRVVPTDVLAAAVPVNAMTFNAARIIGPAIGGIVLATMGVPLCYLLNGISFLALIWAVTAIKADLSPHPGAGQPIKDLIFEGMRYTIRDPRLRTLFVLEIFTAAFGIAYMPLLPAYVVQLLGAPPDKSAQLLGYAFTAVGVGALIGLLLVIHYAHTEKKGLVIRLAMCTSALGLLALSVTRIHWIAFIILAFLGAASVSQFNTTNALFQLLSPDRLRGRVLAMHIWALNGLSPFGVLFFGWLATASRESGGISLFGRTLALPLTGVPLVLRLGGLLMLIGAIGALLARRGLSGLNYDPSVV